MKKRYILAITIQSGLKSNEMEFDNLYRLFDYIKRNEHVGWSYHISMRF